jgi:uncharacterized membrane protein YkoI
VSDAERSDARDHAYTVEVRLDNGDDVDVELDEQFDVVRVDGVVPGTGSTTSPSPGATAGDDSNQPISAEDRASAEQAALAEVGSGTVTELERSDDFDHAWEVEITGAAGRDTDVELDADFAVVNVG